MKTIKSFLTLFFACLCFGVSAQTMLAAGEGDASKTPSADIPAQCSAFLGVWTGKWDYGNYGEMRLEVNEVDTNCIAKGSYGPSDSQKPWPFEGAEISGDKLSWLCNKARGGTCVFEYHGDTIWAKYHDPSGGRNNGVFKKVAK